MTELHPRQAAAATALIALAYLPLSAHMRAGVSAFVALLVVWRFAALRWPQLLPGRWLLLPLTVAGMTSVFASYHTLAGQQGGTALLATMLALKLLETKTRRDARAVTVLFGFLLVSQFLFDQSAWLAVYLALLLLADLALMVDLAAAGQPSPRHSLALAGRLALQALPLTLVLFVLFPRLSAPLWDLSLGGAMGRTGMSDTLEPGAISQLVLSGELAFRVRFDGLAPPADRLYWRGPVAWSTDGRRWTGDRARDAGRPAAPLAEAADGRSYQVTLEPTGQRTLFALDMPVEVPGDAHTNASFEVLARDKVEEPRRYRMVSALRYDTGALPPEQRAAGLQLPANVTPRMRTLALRLKQQTAAPWDLVRAGLRFFNRQPFYYTLLPPPLGDNPADEFLFETRRGFCEHYATSFALLMRIAGIPSRIVMGYLGGERNPLADYLIVRQSDAHAWVEVWLQGRGWTRVDPTAAVAPQRVERNDFLSNLAAGGAPARFRLGDPGAIGRWAHQLRLLADALDAGWRNWVLDYSSKRQQRLLEAVGLGMLREYGLALAMILASAIVLALAAAAMGRRSPPRDPLARVYDRFCRRLAAQGLPRRPSEGPLAFGARAGRERPALRKPIQSFLTLYLPLRYGQMPDSGEALRELKRRLAHVSAALRRRR